MHVHVRGRRLQGEERGIETGQTLHRTLPADGIVRPRAGCVPRSKAPSDAARHCGHGHLVGVPRRRRVGRAVDARARSGRRAGRRCSWSFGFFAAWSTTELAPIHLVVADRRGGRVRRARRARTRGPVGSRSGSRSCRGSGSLLEREGRRCRRTARSPTALRDALGAGLGRRPRSRTEARGPPRRSGAASCCRSASSGAASTSRPQHAVRRRRHVARHRLDVYRRPTTPAGRAGAPADPRRRRG